MRNIIVQGAAILALSSFAHAQARVIITEIMYNPASTEKRGETEWIEIANVGNEAIEFTDWQIKIVDKKVRWGKFSCTLAPGGVAVLINADAVNEEQFRAAWDATDENGTSESAKHTYQVIAVKWGALANNPSPENPLQLLNDKDEIVCEIKQTEGWPKVKGAGGPSVFLFDSAASDLNDGTHWRISEIDKDGARTNKVTAIFDKQDIGSPGYVHGLSPSVPVAKPAIADAEKPKADETIDY